MRFGVLFLCLLGACPDPSDPGVDAVVAVQVSIDPADPSTDEDLVAIASGTVAGEPAVLSFRWELDGEESSYSGDTVPSDATRKGQLWTVLAFPEGGLPAEAERASVTIANSAPEVTVRIEPENPRVDEPLEVVYEGTDADADNLTFTFDWTVDGAEIALDASTIPAAETAPGERWEVTVTPNDGESDGEPVKVGVTIENRPPELNRVWIEPEVFRTGEPVSVGIDAVDPDGDELTYSYSWWVNGEELEDETGEELTGDHFVHRDEVQVEVIASDGGYVTDPVLSDVAVTANTPPTVTSADVTWSGDAVYGAKLTCEASGMADADGESTTASLNWYADGKRVAGGAVYSIGVPGGTEVVCRAAAFDGFDEGDSVESSAVTVKNTKPTAPRVVFSPSPPKVGDVLTATASGSTDVDGDKVTYSYAWERNGAALPDTTPALSLSGFKKNDLIKVIVTPNDGTEDGPRAETSIAIANTAPAAPTVSFDNTSPDVTDTLKAIATGSDPDGDALTYTYVWKVGGKTVSEKSASLKLSGYAKGQVVTVSVTPNDGTASGPASSAKVTIVNAPPTRPSNPSLTPLRPTSGQDLSCAKKYDATDADGDRLTYTAKWERQDGWKIDDMTAYATGSTTRTSVMKSTYTKTGQTWRCWVEVTDGTATSSTATSSVGKQSVKIN